MDTFSKLVTILLFIAIHPLVYAQTIAHGIKNPSHRYAMDMLNFMYNVYCMQCDHVFITEFEE